jgi:hypothetical protein
MATDLGPLLAILVLNGWCTVEEAEKVRFALMMMEIPGTVKGCIEQFETALAVVRANGR